ncbi:MAG: amidohydrolase family protein [Acidimicrobiales bacterium]
MSVDVHNHVMPTEVLDLLRSEPSYGVTIGDDAVWRGAHHVPFLIDESFHDPAAKLAYMDERDVTAAVCSPPPTLFFYEVDDAAVDKLCQANNEGLARFCERGADRLHWLANLPMQNPDAAAAAYRGAVRDGAVGAAIGTSVAGRRLDGPEFEVFWAAATHLGLPVLIHPAWNEPHAALDAYYLQNVIGNPLETTVMVERMICAGVLARHRNVRLILLHGGGYVPYQAGRLAHACTVRPEIAISADDVWDAFGQLYFDTITHDAAALRYLVERVGADRVVLGTDMPYDMSTDRPMEALAEALDAGTAKAVADANPARLFGLDGGR